MSTASSQRIGFAFAIGRWASVAACMGMLGACIPAPVPPPAEAVLAGHWVFPGAAINSAVNSLLLTFDDSGVPEGVEYQFGDADPVSEQEVAGAAGANGGAVTMSVGFGTNTLGFDGVLDTASNAMTGFVSLLIEVDGIAVRMSRVNATLTRTTTLEPDQHVLAGTWSLKAPSSQLREILIDFDDAGGPEQYSSQLGSNQRRTDLTPEGTATVDGDSATLDLNTIGAVSARDYFRFAGALERDEQLLRGTVSLRQSGGNITVTATEVPAALARLNSPPSGVALLEGTWEFVSPGADPPLTTLRLTFDAQNRLTQIVFEGLGQDERQFSNLATRTDQDGGVVTVSASTSGGDTVFFDGVIDASRAVMVGWLALDIQETLLSQEPAILVKQSASE